MCECVFHFDHGNWTLSIPAMFAFQQILVVVNAYLLDLGFAGQHMYAYRHEGRLVRLDAAEQPWQLRPLIHLYAEGRLLGGSPVTYPNLAFRASTVHVSTQACIV